MSGPVCMPSRRKFAAYIYALTNDDGYGITVFFTSRDYNRSGIEYDDPKAELRKDIELAFFCVAFSDWKNCRKGNGRLLSAFLFSFREERPASLRLKAPWLHACFADAGRVREDGGMSVALQRTVGCHARKRGSVPV